MMDSSIAEEDELLDQIIARPNQASKAGLLIVKLNDLIKKPVIDEELSKVLSEYLDQLGTSQLFLNDGIFNTNFSEGALLLQSATALYSKKVDLLWDCVISSAERMVRYEEKTPENESEFQKIEERKQRFKRKRKVSPENEDPENQNSRTSLLNLVDIKEEEDEELVKILQGNLDFDKPKIKNNYTLLEIHQRNLRVSKENVSVECNQAIPNSLSYFLREQLPNGEVESICDMGRASFYDVLNAVDEVVFLKKISMPRTVEEIEPFDFFEHVSNNYLLKKDQRVEDIYENIDLFFKEFELLSRMYLKRGKKAKWRGIPQHLLLDLEESDDEEESSDGEDNGIVNQKSPERHEPPNGTDNNKPVETNDIKNNNDDPDSVVDNNTQNEDSPNEVEIINEQANQAPRKTLDSRSDIDSGYFDQNGLDRRQTPITPFQLMSPTPEESEKNQNEVPTSISHVIDFATFKKTLQVCPSVVSNISEEHTYFHKPKKLKLISKNETSTPKKASVKRLRLRPVTIASLSKFEIFFFNNYQPEEGEGMLIEPPPLELEDSYYDMDTADNTEVSLLDVSSTSKDILNNTGGGESGYDTNNISIEGEENPEQTESTNELNLNTPKKKGSEDNDSPKEIEVDEVELRSQRYMEWWTFINSKIMNRKESDFDIHEEGGNIIKTIGEVGAKSNFKDICAGKSAESVSRTFISMLQLANNYNVEIISQGFGLANNTLELKLLSEERHCDSLNRYQAPSELDIRQKIGKFKIPSVINRKRVSFHGKNNSISKKAKL